MSDLEKIFFLKVVYKMSGRKTAKRMSRAMRMMKNRAKSATMKMNAMKMNAVKMYAMVSNAVTMRTRRNI